MNCYRCGQSFHRAGSVEELLCAEEYRRKENESFQMLLALGIVVVALIVIVKIVHAELVYDDWTCAVAKCVKVINGEE